MPYRPAEMSSSFSLEQALITNIENKLKNMYFIESVTSSLSIDQ
jgi:hypothetical protein